MRKKWKQSRVDQIYDLSASVKGVDMIVEGDEKFEFVPGQFITLDLPIGEKRLDRWRSYSIVNTSNDKNLIQLAVSYIEGGRASDYFFKSLQVGDTLELKGPDGVFCLPDKLNRPLVMICTGTGVAPFKSMISHIYDNKIENQGIHLIYGTRYEEGILYRAFFESMEKNLSGFQYSVALSRESFRGFQGYVHELYADQYAEAHDNIKFYLCGWQHVIDEAKARLLSLGYSKEQVVLELYG